eukprot:359869-Chlamydomonas_euryale.AAC.42
MRCQPCVHESGSSQRAACVQLLHRLVDATLPFPRAHGRCHCPFAPLVPLRLPPSHVHLFSQCSSPPPRPPTARIPGALHEARARHPRPADRPHGARGD